MKEVAYHVMSIHVYPMGPMYGSRSGGPQTWPGGALLGAVGCGNPVGELEGVGTGGLKS